MAQGRDIFFCWPWQVISGLSDQAISDDLEWPSKSFTCWKPSQMCFSNTVCIFAWTLCNSRASCYCYWKISFALCMAGMCFVIIFLFQWLRWFAMWLTVGYGHWGVRGNWRRCWPRQRWSRSTCCMLLGLNGYAWSCCVRIWNSLRLWHFHARYSRWLAGKLINILWCLKLAVDSNFGKYKTFLEAS